MKIWFLTSQLLQISPFKRIFKTSMHGLGRENPVEWSSLGRSFERYIHHEWKLFARPRRPRLQQDASDCLKHFDAESHFWKASGASLWDDFWEDDLELCEEIGQSRYVFFCHALPQSRAWRLEASRMGHIGQVLSEVWADEAEEEILSTLRRQVAQEIVEKLGKWNVIQLCSYTWSFKSLAQVFFFGGVYIYSM